MQRGSCVVQVVTTVHAFYSDNLCSNPDKVYNFSAKLLLKGNNNKRKEAEVGPQ